MAGYLTPVIIYPAIAGIVVLLNLVDSWRILSHVALIPLMIRVHLRIIQKGRRCSRVQTNIPLILYFFDRIYNLPDNILSSPTSTFPLDFLDHKLINQEDLMPLLDLEGVV